MHLRNMGLPLLVVVLLTLMAVPFFPQVVYIVFVMKALCFVLFACAFNLLLGHTGILSFGHAAFFGSGAYVTGHLVKAYGLPTELGILAGGLAAALLGAVIGALAIRRSGIYLAMITLAMSQLVFFFFLQAPFAGAEDGLQRIPRGTFLGLLDVTTTEICDLMMGGVFSAGEQRLDILAQCALPYVGSCGALDMVNFAGIEAVPERYRQRLLYEHNPQITLMRTTAEENARMGRWIGEKLNQSLGPVRFLLPEGGVSALDAEGQPFHDPDADAALFEALEQTVRQTSERQLIRSPHHINDPAFAAQLVEHFNDIMAIDARREH